MIVLSLPQVQACQLLQKSLCISELKVCFEDAEWEQLISGVMAQAAKVMARQRKGLCGPGPLQGAVGLFPGTLLPLAVIFRSQSWGARK